MVIRWLCLFILISKWHTKRKRGPAGGLAAWRERWGKRKEGEGRREIKVCLGVNGLRAATSNAFYVLSGQGFVQQQPVTDQIVYSSEHETVWTAHVNKDTQIVWFNVLGSRECPLEYQKLLWFLSIKKIVIFRLPLHTTEQWQKKKMFLPSFLSLMTFELKGDCFRIGWLNQNIW